MKKNAKNRLRSRPIKCIGGGLMRKITLLFALLFVFGAALSASAARTENLNFKSQFVFKDRNGKMVSAPIVDEYQQNRIVRPVAKIDPKLDPKLVRAATIADERANAHSKSRCWRYVKEALL